ncbi:hypothetical protein [Streptomyces sp. CBMA123]|uniref:hypothetical protein n=1 Tax=Streptomyces sp. CBMA123 TaxID=1896313 RepID=UPI001661C963|nr:hypothetical protein [Streptomyces sp. CBMA123]MBD0688829.1 hypothetical protein [Streptomyces sp. CBMA123]
MSSSGIESREIVNSVINSVARLDRDGLRRLDSEGLSAQFNARLELEDYFHALWEHLKECGERPAVRTEYQPLAAVLDLLASLSENAMFADGVTQQDLFRQPQQ